MKFLFILLLTQTRAENTQIYHSLKESIVKNLNYIKDNPEKCNPDCLLGVAFAAGKNFLSDLIDFSVKALAGNEFNDLFDIYDYLRNNFKAPANQYIIEHVIDPKIWYKTIQFDKHLNYWPNKDNTLEIFNENGPSTDYCLENIVNETINLNKWKLCSFDNDCIEKFLNFNNLYHGYLLTHQLLLLQVIKARKCVLNPFKHSEITKKICSKIYKETFSIYFYEKHNLFDLFLEQSNKTS